MSETFINAMMGAASRAPDTVLAAASSELSNETTLGEVVAAGRRMGTRLTALGVSPGDILGCMLPNWREWPVVAVAAAQSGAVMLPIVTNYGPSEVGFILRRSGAKWLFTPRNFRGTDYARLVADCGDLPLLEQHIMTGASFDILTSDGPIDVPVPSASDDLALLVYTSGTTGAAKGVKHSAKGILAEIRTMPKIRASGGADVILSPWPPGHIAGALAMYRFLCQATPLIMMDQWSPVLAAELVTRFAITNSSGTPFHLSGLLDAAEEGAHDLGSLEEYIVGAAPVPPSVIARCQAQGLAVYHCYGSSEHPSVTSGTTSDPIEKQLHTEGRAIEGVELRFIDDDGHDVTPGEAGEICTRGPELFTGYLDSSLDAEAFLHGGWFRTGDIGMLDEDGYLLVTDRKKDIIIRGGENISSKEVEAILLAHPAIADAAVVAAQNDRMGEIVHACVVLRPDRELTLEMLVTHFFSSGIAKQKTPEKLSVLTSLPRNASGKVLKHVLRNS